MKTKEPFSPLKSVLTEDSEGRSCVLVKDVTWPGYKKQKLKEAGSRPPHPRGPRRAPCTVSGDIKKCKWPGRCGTKGSEQDASKRHLSLGGPFLQANKETESTSVSHNSLAVREAAFETRA